jgi:hypothetical protein
VLIKRYCGRERLPGGARLLRRMAKLAEFDGVLEVYGYGVGGAPGRQQRSIYRHGDIYGFVQGDWSVGDGPERIRVWLRCVCSAVEFDPDLEQTARDNPLVVFAHELGHHRQHVEGSLQDEGGATKRGANLINAARMRAR